MILKKRDTIQSIVSDFEATYETKPFSAVLGHQAGDLSDVESDTDKFLISRKGLPKSAATHMQILLDLTAQEMSRLLNISYRTYQRKKEDEYLDIYSTSQLLEIAEVITQAMEVFGQYSKVKSWLKTPLIGFGNQKPLDFLDSTFGIRLIKQALGRLSHGIFA